MSNKRGLSPIVAAIFTFLLLMGCAFWLFFKESRAGMGWQPREMALTQYSHKDVVGNLGGIKVTMPRHVVEYVEYDGDSRWGEKRSAPPPARSHESILRSFGINVRFPDMRTLSSPAMWQDKRSYSIQNTPWLDPGVTTGEFYPGTGFLDRRAKATVVDQGGYWFTRYEQLPKKMHDLTVYAVKGTDPKTGQPYRMRPDAKDVLIARNSAGQVTTYIKCGNSVYAVGGVAVCQQTWSLEGEGIHAEIYVGYGRYMLPNWQEIQDRITQFILGFKVHEALHDPSVAEPRP